MTRIQKSRNPTTAKRRKAGSGRTTRQRSRARRSPEEALNEQLNLIKTKLTTANRRNVLDQHPISCMCRDIRDNVDERYGKAPIKKALEVLGWSRQWFGKVASVADRWPTENDIVAVGSRLDCRDIPLSWSHLVELAGLETALFERLLDEALEKGQSVRDLKARIAEEQAGGDEEDDQHADYEAPDCETIDYDIDLHNEVEHQNAGDDAKGDDVEDDEIEDDHGDSHQDDEPDLAGSDSGDRSEVDTADAEAPDDPVESALAYLESGRLDVKCEFIASAELDAASFQDITPDQRWRLETIADETEEMLHLLGLRLSSLNRLLEPEETPPQGIGKTARAKAAA